jgi:hypothetical protein
MSESESEEEDVPKAICGPALSQTSSVTILNDHKHLLAIEADPYREKAFKIATELLTTERSYVALLHLIDQVIVHGAYLSCLSVVPEVSVTVVPPTFSAPYFIRKLRCANFQFVVSLEYFLGTGWSCLLFKCYQKKCLCSILKKVGCL